MTLIRHCLALNNWKSLKYRHTRHVIQMPDPSLAIKLHQNYALGAHYYLLHNYIQRTISFWCYCTALLVLTNCKGIVYTEQWHEQNYIAIPLNIFNVVMRKCNNKFHFPFPFHWNEEYGRRTSFKKNRILWIRDTFISTRYHWVALYYGFSFSRTNTIFIDDDFNWTNPNSFCFI